MTSGLGLGEIELKIGNLRLTPDDILVVKITTDRTPKQMAYLAQVAERMAVKFGANVMVIPHNVDISVIRKIDIVLDDPATVICMSGAGKG